MIRPLRRRHLVVWGALAAALPVLAALALAGRSPRPVGSVPPELVPPSGPGDGGAWTSLSGSTGVEARLLRAEGGTLLELRGELAAPDLLVYWHPSPAPGTEATDGHLLGSWDGLRPRRFELPSSPPGESSVVVYSLGHRRAVTSGTLSAPDPEGG